MNLVFKVYMMEGKTTFDRKAIKGESRCVFDRLRNLFHLTLICPRKLRAYLGDENLYLW